MAVNDNCAAAIVIGSLPYSDTKSIHDNTAEGTDPNNTARPGGAAPAFRGGWYEWTAPGNMVMFADLFGTDDYTPPNTGVPFLLLAVYTGSCGGPWTQIAAAAQGHNPGNAWARIKFSAVNGTTYRFHYGALNTTGTVSANTTFNLYQDPGAPANDAFANRQVINEGDNIGPIDTRAQTTDPSDPATSWWGQAQPGVWFEFVAAATGTIDLDAIGSNYEVILSIWTGTYPALTEIVSFSDFTTGSLISGTNVVGGTTYYIHAETLQEELALAGGAGGGGELFVNLGTSAPASAPPPPDASAVGGPNSIIVTWPAIAVATGFEVEYCVGIACGNWAPWDILGGGATGFNDAGTPGTTYRYRIRTIRSTNPPGLQFSAWVEVEAIPLVFVPPPPPQPQQERIVVPVGCRLDEPHYIITGTPCGWFAKIEPLGEEGTFTLIDWIQGNFNPVQLVDFTVKGYTDSSQATPIYGDWDHSYLRSTDTTQTWRPYSSFIWFGLRNGFLQLEIFDGRSPDSSIVRGSGIHEILTAPIPVPVNEGCIHVGWVIDWPNIAGATGEIRLYQAGVEIASVGLPAQTTSGWFAFWRDTAGSTIGQSHDTGFRLSDTAFRIQELITFVGNTAPSDALILSMAQQIPLLELGSPLSPRYNFDGIDNMRPQHRLNDIVREYLHTAGPPPFTWTACHVSPRNFPPPGEVPCCDTPGGPPPPGPGPPPPNPGPVVPPPPTEVPPPWVPSCIGGAGFLSQADPVPSEDWDPVFPQ